MFLCSSTSELTVPINMLEQLPALSARHKYTQIPGDVFIPPLDISNRNVISRTACLGITRLNQSRRISNESASLEKTILRGTEFSAARSPFFISQAAPVTNKILTHSPAHSLRAIDHGIPKNATTKTLPVKAKANRRKIKGMQSRLRNSGIKVRVWVSSILVIFMTTAT